MKQLHITLMNFIIFIIGRDIPYFNGQAWWNRLTQQG